MEPDTTYLQFSNQKFVKVCDENESGYASAALGESTKPFVNGIKKANRKSSATVIGNG